MNKPKNYDTTNIYTDITPGGHYCKILKVEETKSKSGKDMLIISFDTDGNDRQAGFYAARYKSECDNPKPDREPKWRGVQYLVTEGEYGDINLKRFITAVEESNDGFEVQWGDAFSGCFKDKKVGIVFREEEYTKEDHTVGMSVKPFRFCAYDKAPEQKVPKMKEAPAPEPDLYTRYTQAQEQAPKQMSWGNPAANDGFMKVPEDALNDEGLPFL